jgi:hypothetical protein
MPFNHTAHEILDDPTTTPEAEQCPWCGQAITHEQFETIQKRIKDEERRRLQRYEAELRQKFEHEKTEAIDLANEKASEQIRDLQSSIVVLRREKDEVAEEERRKAAEREGQIQIEAKQVARKELEGELASAQEEKVVAEQGRKEAENRVKDLHEELRVQHQEELRKQREVLEKDAEKRLNEEKAKAFQDGQKMEGKLDDLKRQLQAKTASELGEGAEVDLFEALRNEFEDDRISRIDKGEPGADIRHEIMADGQICGRIMFDSKNRKAWRNDYVDKLRTDQLAADADHAVLTTTSFPAGESQICVREGVIIANPARALAIVTILREQVIQSHRLRLSGQDRDSKSAQLYDFINSERCEQMFRREEELAESLLELDVKEQRTHESTWEKRGALLRKMEKNHHALRSEIHRIIQS